MGEFNFIPFGENSLNQQTVFVDASGSPMASCIEILPNLPSNQNFPGRMVYLEEDHRTYVFSRNKFIPLEGEGVIVGNTDPTSSTSGIFGDLIDGSLYWNRINRTLFVRNNNSWTAIMGSGTGGTTISSRSFDITGTNTRTFPVPITTDQDIDVGNIEVFIDGVRQYPEENYNLISNVVVLVNPAPQGTKVLIRVISDISLTSNSNIVETIHSGDASKTEFDIGQVLSNDGTVMVFIDGALQASSTYNIERKDVKVTNINKIARTTGRPPNEVIFKEIVLTVNATIEEHKFIENSIISLHGLLRNSAFSFYINRDLTVKSVANASGSNPTTSTITFAAYDDGMGDGINDNENENIDYNVILLPRTRTDCIKFIVDNDVSPSINNTPGSGTNNIIIRSFKNVINGLTEDKGATVTEINSENNYVIPPRSNLSFIGVNTTSPGFSTGDITINLHNIAGVNGKIITIKDTGGGTSEGVIEHDIVIESVQRNPDNSVPDREEIDNENNYIINKALGYVTLIYASNKWNVISKG